MGVMIEILKDCRLLNHYPTVALFLSRGSYRRFIGLIHYGSRQTWKDFETFAYACCNGGLGLETSFLLLERCLVDYRMGSCRLTNDKFADGCLSWMTDLMENPQMRSSKPMRVQLNQCRLMLNRSRRLKRTPFLWRTTKRIVQPCRTKGRLHFLQTCHRYCPRGRGTKTGFIDLGTACDPTPHFIPPGMHGSFKAYRPFHWAVENEAISELNKTLIQHGNRFTYWTFEERTVKRFHPFERPEKNFIHINEEDRRYHEFGFILSRIPAMLAKASRLDALAALRFKSFPPLARNFPKLTRRAHRAMDQYARRYGYPIVDSGLKTFRIRSVPTGYPAIEGTFGPPMQHVVNHTQDAVHVANSDVASRTCLFIMRRRLEYGRLRLAALLGGLDAIYTLG